MDLAIAFLVVLFFLGMALLWLGRRMQDAAGLPPGRIVSHDMSGARRPGEALYDPVLDLAGRPDYLVESGGRWIPVEVKSGRSHAGPRRSHRLQLAAYCRLVEAVYARRPPYGILQYADRAFELVYSPAVERELTEVLETMRRDAGRTLDRSHDAPERCVACAFRTACDQSLA